MIESNFGPSIIFFSGTGTVHCTVRVDSSRGLQKTNIFHQHYCDDGQLKAIIDKMELRTFAAGDHIVTQNEPGDSFVVITKGTADVMQEGQW